jgi:hypothetical protein
MANFPQATQKFHSEAEAANLYGGTADGLRTIRTGRKIPPDKTPLLQGFHWFKVGRLVRFDLARFEFWLTEPKEIHQKRIDDYFASLATTPVEGVRPVGRPRKEVSTK